MHTLKLETVYRSNISLIFRYFRLRTFSKEVAEDLTSEVFTRLARKFSVVENESEQAAKAYLFGIAKLVFIEYLKQKYTQQLPLGDQIDDFADHVKDFVDDNSEYKQRHTKLMSLIEKLPEKQKLVISMRLIEKLSLNEISIKLAKDSNYVRTTQKRALANLKKLWACTQLTTSILELTPDHE